MLNVAVAQLAPVFLDRDATLAKVITAVREAASNGAHLAVFGETLVPAYPLWLARTDGTRFEDPDQKQLHGLYLEQAVTLEAGHLDPVCEAARDNELAVVLGVAERPLDRGGHTIYCSRVFIDANGRVASVHRKLVPTHEERLAWGMGDGAGLVTHAVGEFCVGALNCWENWMPLARAALYAAGENLHVALWPGGERLTRDITRFIARESRSFVVSVSGIIREPDIPATVPLRDRMVKPGETVYDGGSCVAGPDGQWIVEPLTGREALVMAALDLADVRQARQNFDPVGHYARPDVLRLLVDQRRQRAAERVSDMQSALESRHDTHSDRSE